MASRCLIIANQTLGGTALEEAVRDCIERGVATFHVVVPMTAVEHEATAWTGGFALGEMGVEWTSSVQSRAALEEDARRREAAIDEARARAKARLDLMVEKIEDLGGAAEGNVGSGDPVAASKDALEQHGPFDEVIVSTLPTGISRWLKLDLPNRVARMTDAKVTTIVAQA